MAQHSDEEKTAPNTAAEQSVALSVFLATFWVALVLIFGFATEFDSSVLASKGEMGPMYVYYQQIATMVLVGIGFLYAFLRRYAYGAQFRLLPDLTIMLRVHLASMWVTISTRCSTVDSNLIP